tara:strand:- start:314 stop:646 length:333 start_codon:yes stop_codon:yes gene_type:complete
MAKFKNTAPQAVILRRGNGARLFINPFEVITTDDSRWITEMEFNRAFIQVEEIGHGKVGAGLKTHVRDTKRKRTPSKPKKEIKSLKSKISKKIDKALKKPKGLRKPKRAN